MRVRRPTSFADCVVWARLKFEELFTNNIKQLLFNFPLEMFTPLAPHAPPRRAAARPNRHRAPVLRRTTAAGTPFWSGPKRPPSPLVFDASDPLHTEFVLAAANLRAANFSIAQCRDLDSVKAAVQDVMVPEFTPQKGVKIQVTEAEAEAAAQGVDVDDAALDKVAAELPPAKDVAAMRLSPAEFEKDDDTNFHIDFVAAWCAVPPARCEGVDARPPPAMSTRCTDPRCADSPAAPEWQLESARHQLFDQDGE